MSLLVLLGAPPPPPETGFHSPAWLGVGGIGSGSEVFNLVQSGTVTVNGTLTAAAPSLTSGVDFGVIQSGTVTVNGTVTTPDTAFEVVWPYQGFTSASLLSVGGIGVPTTAQLNLACQPLAINGTLAVSGQIQTWYDFVSNALAINSTTAVSGQIGTTINVAVSSLTTINGTVLTAADVQFATVFNLAQTGSLILNGATNVSGNLDRYVNLVQSGTVTVNGIVGVSGNLDRYVNLAQSGAVTANGTVGVSGDLNYSINKDIGSGSLVIDGTVGVSGDIEHPVEYEFESSLFIDITGSMSVAGDLEGVGPITHDLVCQAIAINGTVLTNGSTATIAFGIRHELVTQPVAVIGTIAQSGNIEAFFPRDLTFEALLIDGVVTVDGDIQRDIDLSAAQADMAGVLTLSGDVEVFHSIDLSITSSLDFTGTLNVSGSLESTTDILLDVVPTPVAINGVISAAADIAFNLAGGLALATYPIDIAGAVSVTGDIRIDDVWNLETQSLTISGSMQVFGDPQQGVNVELQIAMNAMNGDVTIVCAGFQWGFGFPVSVDRTLYVAPETRLVYVPAEDREVYVDPEFPDVAVEGV